MNIYDLLVLTNTFSQNTLKIFQSELTPVTLGMAIGDSISVIQFD